MPNSTFLTTPLAIHIKFLSTPHVSLLTSFSLTLSPMLQDN
jgi:hypothetical protein